MIANMRFEHVMFSGFSMWCLYIFFLLTGMHRHPFREQLGTVYDISSLSFDIYWTRPEEPYIYWVNKFSHNRMKRMFFSEYSRISLTQMLILWKS